MNRRVAKKVVIKLGHRRKPFWYKTSTIRLALRRCSHNHRINQTWLLEWSKLLVVALAKEIEILQAQL